MMFGCVGMYWANISTSLLNPSVVVNSIIDLLVVSVIVPIIGYCFWVKKHKKIKDDDKSNIIKSLLSEIVINQNQLQPVSDYVNDVLDNGSYEFAEGVLTPKKLTLERGVYSSLLDKIGILDTKIIDKIMQYYSDTKYVEEEYKKFNAMHNLSYAELSVYIFYELDEISGKPSSPTKHEIESFIRYVNKVYELGEDLTKCLNDC